MIGEKLLTKIWETVAHDGISALAAPWQIKREGHARLEVRRQEVLVLAQAEKDAEEIRHGNMKLLPDGTVRDLSEKHGTVGQTANLDFDPTMSHSLILSAANNKESADRIQAEVNLSRTLIYAERNSDRPDEEVSDEAVDPDWFKRWRKSAQEVKAEELQRLWARTLAGEAQAPGTYSLRTLDFLRNLSKIEADQIAKVGRYIFSNFLPKFDNESLESAGIDFEVLLDLQDMGFLTGHTGLGLQKTLASQRNDKYFAFLINHDKILLLDRDAVEPAITISGAALTRVGREVISLGDFTHDMEYIRKFAEHLKSKGVSIRIADWISRADGKGEYQNSVEL